MTTSPKSWPASSSSADIRPVMTPGRLGQGTAVEQSRAIAEVHAAIVVAQQVPRDITRAESDMRRSCAQKALAEKAFFRYKRGKTVISGPSIHLARELARCFGNVQYGLVELRRDDEYGQSEMLAFAWDVQSNTRSSTTVIVPHRRDKTTGPELLIDMRDIYENNANNGARRLREMIFSIIPGWYAEDAIAACYKTLSAADEDGATIAERADKAIQLFAALKIRQGQLEQKLGAPAAKWTPHDLAQLHVIYKSITRGETQADDEFSLAPGRVTPAEITGQETDPTPTPAPAPEKPRQDQQQPAPTPAQEE